TRPRRARARRGRAGARRSCAPQREVTPACGALGAAAEEVEPPAAEADEQDADQDPDAAARDRRPDDQGDTEADGDRPEDRDQVPVRTHAARLAAATRTRQGAFLRT